MARLKNKVRFKMEAEEMTKALQQYSKAFKDMVSAF